MKTVLRLVPAALALLLAIPPAAAQNCSNTSVGFTPVDELGTGLYLGAQGGLYPGGSNVRPLLHEIGGLDQVVDIVPRDAAGLPDPAGRIVMMSVGMSNCHAHFSAFLQQSNSDPLRSPSITLVNGAQGGVPAEDMDDPADAYWTSIVPQKLAQAGVTAAQVQVAWLLQANRQPTLPFPTHAENLKAQIASIVRILHDDFPNLRIVYLANRIYAGYATTTLNPEPYAYEQAFALKWLIEDQIAGDPTLNYRPERGPVEAPWLAWGPYTWADGLVPRADGLVWECADFQADGTHPSNQGAAKNAGFLVQFLHADTTARTWYLAQPDPVAYGTGKPTSAGTLPAVGWSGAPSLAAGDFHVTMHDGLPNKPVVLFRGMRPGHLPFQGGFLLVRPPLQRLGIATLDAAGSVSYAIPIGPGMVGGTDHYAFWFRDPTHPDGSGSGLSNALQVRYR